MSLVHEKFDVWLSLVRMNELGSFYPFEDRLRDKRRSSLATNSTSKLKICINNVYLASFGRKFITDLIQLIGWTRPTCKSDF